MSETTRLYGGNPLKITSSEAATSYLGSIEEHMLDAMRNAVFHTPAPFKELIKLPNGIIGMGNKMGEGWLLTAEMVELAESGYENIVCTQPFGCLPNHICGKGMINKIRTLHPGANITPIDYDPSAASVNQENRIKLMLAVARERLDTSETVNVHFDETPVSERGAGVCL